MIPVLGVPYINRPDLLQTMLRSVDVEVGEVVIIDNSPDAELRGLTGPNKSRVISMHHNLGVSASWNLIIKVTPKAPWWFIVNSDIEFYPGELAGVVEAMEGFDGVTTLVGLSAFGISKEAIAKAGWFDENFVPAYCEDNDFHRRCQLTGVEWKDLEPGSKTTHGGSQVIGSSPWYRNENNRTYPLNVAYYRQKWGGGIHDAETFTTPFNSGAHPSNWQLDIHRLANQTWK